MHALIHTVWPSTHGQPAQFRVFRWRSKDGLGRVWCQLRLVSRIAMSRLSAPSPVACWAAPHIPVLQQAQSTLVTEI